LFGEAATNLEHKCRQPWPFRPQIKLKDARAQQLLSVRAKKRYFGFVTPLAWK